MPRALLAPIGWLAAVAAAAWLAGPSSGGAGASRLLLLVAGAACSLVAGLALPRRLAPAYGIGCAGAVVLLVVSSPDGLSGDPLAGPLGYGNANGALCAQGAAAAMIPVLVVRSMILRVVSLVLAGILVALAAATASAAGLAAAAVCVAVPLALLAVRGGRCGLCRVVVAAFGVGIALVLLMTIGLGTGYEADARQDAGIDRLVDRTLTERRVALWSEAIDLVVQHPVGGVGPGRFDEVSPTARSDEDARWAHSGFLQYGAETGLPGLLALLGLTGWVFVALWRTCHDGILSVVGACAAAAAVGHATVDYVLHFPPVPLLALVTLGVCLRQAGWGSKGSVTTDIP